MTHVCENKESCGCKKIKNLHSCKYFIFFIKRINYTTTCVCSNETLHLCENEKLYVCENKKSSFL